MRRSRTWRETRQLWRGVCSKSWLTLLYSTPCMKELAPPLPKWPPKAFPPTLHHSASLIVPGERLQWTYLESYTHQPLGYFALWSCPDYTQWRGDNSLEGNQASFWLFFFFLPYSEKDINNNALECNAIRVPANVAPADPFSSLWRYLVNASLYFSFWEGIKIMPRASEPP